MNEKLDYFDILKKNSNISENDKSKRINIRILSNITLLYMKDILTYFLNEEGIQPNININSYNNILQEVTSISNDSVLILFWEPANFIENLFIEINNFNSQQIQNLLQHAENEIEYLFEKIINHPMVIFNKFSSSVFSHGYTSNTDLDNFANKLNEILIRKKSNNVHIVDLDKILLKLSINNAVDWRFFYSSKALYTSDFMIEYVESIIPIIRSFFKMPKKAIILDCDNILWKGFLSDEGNSGIQMNKDNPVGCVYYEIQNIFRKLSKNGIKIGICSENNDDELKNIFMNHPDSQLKMENFAIINTEKKDKVSKIKDISKELCVDVDSILYIDNSDNVLNYVRNELPTIVTFQIPKNIFIYPNQLRMMCNNFYIHPNYILESKTQCEKNIKDELNRKTYSDIEDYLKSLNLGLDIHIDNNNHIKKISQMTQKTKHFNLTNKEYSEDQIRNFIRSENFICFTFIAKDQFSVLGVTGVCIIELFENNSAVIDSLLMSCSVFGRKLEFAFLDYIFNNLKDRKISVINGNYYKTEKNIITKKIYRQLGFDLITKEEHKENYKLLLTDYISNKISFIKVKEYEKQNF